MIPGQYYYLRLTIELLGDICGEDDMDNARRFMDGTGDGDIEPERVLRLECNFFGGAKRFPISSDGT